MNNYLTFDDLLEAFRLWELEAWKRNGRPDDPGREVIACKLTDGWRLGFTIASCGERFHGYVPATAMPDNMARIN